MSTVSHIVSVKKCQGKFPSEMDRFQCLLEAVVKAKDKGGEEAVKEIKKIQKEVAQRYGVKKAVLIVDLGGFTDIVRDEKSIVNAMALVQEVWTVLKPVIVKRGGEVVKDEADTFYALLPGVNDAVLGALEMETGLKKLASKIERKRGKKASKFEKLSVGIGYGQIMRIGTKKKLEDAFGIEVNYAYGAGEETAEHGEILLTTDARKQLAKELGGADKLPKGVTFIAKRPKKNYDLWSIQRKSTTFKA